MSNIIAFLSADISLTQYIILSLCLFALGAIGVAMQKNVIGMIMSSEVMVLAIILLFVASSSYHGNIDGQIFAMFILASAAAETAIGLVIFVMYFSAAGNVDTGKMKKIKE